MDLHTRVPAMPHLSAERLAALADTGTSPAPLEADHLAECDRCASEIRAYGILVSDAGDQRGAIAAPLTNWEGIAAGLRAEGILGGGAPAGRRPPAVHVRTRWLQVAAAAMLLAGGAAAGRMSAVAGPLAVATDDADAVEDARPPADAAGAASLIPDYRSVAEAQAARARFELAYQHAVAYLADNDTAARLDTPDDYRTRLVALDRAGRTMREAMEAAPYDPVLTGYYLTTLGQREATLRQLNVAVPAGARLNSF